jgi:hypothetical protein
VLHHPRLTLVRVIVVGLFTLCASRTLHAQSVDDPPPIGRVGASECCLALLLPVGARAVALGNALTARPGADALLLNPAGLGAVVRDEFRIHNAPTDVETSNTFSIAVRIGGAGVAALTYRLVDYGESEATDPQGNPTGTIRLLDHALVATFATYVAPGLTGGISYKVFQFRQDCAGFCGDPGFAATTHGIDAGVQYHPTVWPSLQLGASLVHFGLPLQVINAEQASPMPTRLRVGAAYELMQHFSSDSTTTLWASLDGVGSLREGVAPAVGGGLELALDNTIFVRAGYSSGSGRAAGAAIGVGLRYDRFDLGIARSFAGSAFGGQDPFQVTFAIGF